MFVRNLLDKLLVGLRQLSSHVVFATLFFISYATYAKAPICADLFANHPFVKHSATELMSRAVGDAIKPLTATTTGKRLEQKWTLVNETVSRLITQLQQQLSAFKIDVQLRDKVTPGTVNVTDTIYYQKFTINPQLLGLKLAAQFKDTSKLGLKLRVRGYGTVKAGQAITFENMLKSDFTKDHSFVEFKFEDPSAQEILSQEASNSLKPESPEVNLQIEGPQGVYVFKPRALMPNHVIELFGRPEFLQQYGKIVKEVLSLEANKGSLDEAIAILTFIKSGTEARLDFIPMARNLYERKSYQINFIDQSQADKSFQIQITVDTAIQYFVYQYGRLIQAYAPNVAVIETKTPSEYAGVGLSSVLLNSIPGYATYLKFIGLVSQEHLGEYEAGRGKCYHGKRACLLGNK